jgi:hypothetical protein
MYHCHCCGWFTVFYSLCFGWCITYRCDRCSWCTIFYICFSDDGIVPLVYYPLHLSSKATYQSSTIIQDRALLLTTQSNQQLIVDSVDRSEKGQKQACTVESAVVYIPTDGQYLVQVLTSLLACDAVSVTWWPMFRRSVMLSSSGVNQSLDWYWKMRTAFPSKRRKALI